MGGLRAAYRSLKQRGLKNSVYRSLSELADYAFDIRYGIDTVRWIELKHLTVEGGDKEGGLMYQGTRTPALVKLLRNLRFPDGSVFVDLGCGKGRVLLVASRFGFKEVKGVEFARELCEIARKNVSIYRVKTGIRTEFRIIESDVADYSVGTGDNVFFMYNPFGPAVLRRVLDNIAASLLIRPRQVWILYNNPVFDDVVQAQGTFAKVREYMFWNARFIVYSNG